MSRPEAETDARTAVGALAEEHGETLYRLGLRICDSPDKAEELVQETFLNAYRAWDDFEGRSKPKTWLYTIAKRACIRLQRPRAGEPSEMETLEELLPGPGETVADFDAVDPFDRQLQREAGERIDRALRELPLEFRMPLVLFEIADLTIAEIADVLGLKQSTVKTRLHRGRLKLRRALESGLPQKQAPSTQPSEVCLSMLRAKQEALDRGAAFPYPDDALCERCRAVFATLDLGHETCLQLRHGHVPPALTQRLMETLSSAS